MRVETLKDGKNLINETRASAALPHDDRNKFHR